MHWLSRRTGTVYGAYAHRPDRCDHLAGVCRPGYVYVGKTIRRPESRWSEHMNGSETFDLSSQPWADTVIRWDVLWQKRCFVWYLDIKERRRIWRHRPAYNYTHNLGNWRRISKWEAKRQREVRSTGLCHLSAGKTKCCCAHTAKTDDSHAVMGIRRISDGTWQLYGNGWSTGNDSTPTGHEGRKTPRASHGHGSMRVRGRIPYHGQRQ